MEPWSSENDGFSTILQYSALFKCVDEHASNTIEIRM